MLEQYKQQVIRLIVEAGLELPDSNRLEFENIRSQGCISSIFRVKLKNDSTIVVKLTEMDSSQICSELHNREIAFFRWLSDEEEVSKTKLKCPKYYGGSECVDDMGMILMEDFSARICNDVSELRGFSIDTAVKVAKELAAIQCLQLSSSAELTNNLDRFDYSSSVRNCLPKLDRMEGITAEMRAKLNEWIEPVTLFKIQAELPRDVQGISPALIHCDLWTDNLLFCRNGNEIDLLSIIDWQCFKIGNPLLDVASILGLCMTAEERRAHAATVVRAYVDEIQKSKDNFKRPFDINVDKTHRLLSAAMRWPCVQLMTAVVTISDEEREANPEEHDVLNARLTELMKDMM